MSQKKQIKNYTNGKRCPYCGSTVGIRKAKEITGRNTSELLWVCNNFPVCDAYVSCEKGTGRPLGPLANKSLRKKRVEAHKAFDQLFEQGFFTRTQAYVWLRDIVTPSKRMNAAHIALFTERECEKTIEQANMCIKSA